MAPNYCNPITKVGIQRICAGKYIIFSTKTCYYRTVFAF